MAVWFRPSVNAPGITQPSWLAHLDPEGMWAGLRTLIHIYSQRAVSGAAASQDDRYYNSSVDAPAEKLSKLVRGHWGIENSQHWVLDMAFREDEKPRASAVCGAELRGCTPPGLESVAQETTTKLGVKAKRLKAGWDDAYLLKVAFHV